MVQNQSQILKFWFQSLFFWQSDLTLYHQGKSAVERMELWPAVLENKQEDEDTVPGK